ncbi:hypothetical protein VTH8203_01368 [Vibrio thalassae]|uniref:DUF2913 family protein n=1 Tax=Vibrio thalassae TaxID=1243014 RepID=A0A240EHK9_9VIBR|nr:DUF2913 family protein [Vibrio thalassae]SNX47753.1 hypothetical protein VTH8203_01368 [Vibrio thalassae]
MSKLKYHQQLTDLIYHGLLHLYFHIANNRRFVPIHTRNEILIKWLKPKLKSPKYKAVKSDIKALMTIARKKGGNLEERFTAIQIINEEHKSRFTQADDLYILLTDLYEKHDFPSQLTNSAGNTYESGIIYMAPSEIETGFDDNSNQIRPLEFFVSSGEVEAVIQAIHTHGGYDCEILRTDNDYTYVSLTKLTTSKAT